MGEENQKLLNFSLYWRIIRRRKSYLILPLITTVITFYVIGMFMKPEYQSSTTLMISGEQLVNRELQGIMPGISHRQQTAAIIKSKVVNRVNLLELIQRMKFKEEKAIQKQAEFRLKNSPGYTLDEIMNEMLLEYLDRRISVENVGTEFITIKVTHTQSEKAYLMTKSLAEIFVESVSKTQLGGIQGSLKVGNEQLEIYRRKLEDAEARLRNYEEKIKSDEIENYDISSINLKQLNTMQISTELQIKDAQSQIEALNQKCDPATNQLKITPTPYLQQLIEKLYDRAVELTQLLTQFDWKDAKVIGLNNEIIGIKSEIGQELNKCASQQIVKENQLNLFVRKEILRIELNTYLRQRQELKQQIEGLRQTAVRDPSQNMLRRRLQEEVDSYREISKTLLQQNSGSQIKEAYQETESQFQFEVVEPAFRPLKPVKPNRFRMLLMGIMLGLVIGIVIVFIQEYSDDSFKDLNDIENYLGLIVLGTIPKIEIPKTRADWKKYLRLRLVVLGLFFLGGVLIVLAV
jgi:uncharacterized protein involved in exopolysaccharide biosynthesis